MDKDYHFMKPKIILLVLGLLLFGCGLPGSQEAKNPNVEIIVRTSEDVFSNWKLSPKGDKLIFYSSRTETTYLLDITSKEKQDLNFCVPAIWLDSNNILCKITDNPPFILKSDDFTRILLKKVEVSTIPDLNELLQTATAIYRYEGKYTFEPDRNSFYLLTTASQQNYQIITENVDEVLQGYDYRIIPKPRTIPRENEYSPNGDYYFVNYVRGLTIYDAVTNKEVVGYDYSEQGQLEVGDWATDSSGVYFQPVAGMGMSHLKPGAILKLKVLETYLETTPAP